MPHCNSCNQDKLEMDMNDRDLCKDCWLKRNQEFYLRRSKKAWATLRKNRNVIA